MKRPCKDSDWLGRWLNAEVTGKSSELYTTEEMLEIRDPKSALQAVPIMMLC